MSAKKKGPFLDIGFSSLKVLVGDRGLVAPLERTETGLVTPACRERLRPELRTFLGLRGRASVAALCGLPARGASLRRLDLPPAPREESRQLLLLRVEKEFPLPPSDLAWGYVVGPSLNGAAPPGAREVAVVALRREILEDYERLLADCGLRPAFTLGILAASRLCRQRDGVYGVLDIGRTHSELAVLASGAPLAVRPIDWGGGDVTRAVARALAVPEEKAEELKRADSGGGQLVDLSLSSAVGSSVEVLAREIEEAWRSLPLSSRPSCLTLAGGGSRQPGLAAELGDALGVPAVPLEGKPAPGASAVNLGLEHGPSSGRGPLLCLRLSERAERAPRRAERAVLGFWLAVALLLALSSFALRYGGPIWRLPELEREVREKRRTLEAMPRAGPELAFLEELERAQVPYLEVLAALSRAAPVSTQLSSLSMNRSGSVRFQGICQKSEDANRFRSELLRSGLFSRAVLEQTSTKDRKKWEFQMLASLADDLSSGPRAGVSIPQAEEEPPPPVSPSPPPAPGKGPGAPAPVGASATQETAAAPGPAAGAAGDGPPPPPEGR